MIRINFKQWLNTIEPFYNRVCAFKSIHRISNNQYIITKNKDNIFFITYNFEHISETLQIVDTEALKILQRLNSQSIFTLKNREILHRVLYQVYEFFIERYNMEILTNAS